MAKAVDRVGEVWYNKKGRREPSGAIWMPDRRLAPWGKYDEYFLKGGDCMDYSFLRLLCRLVEVGVIISFRVTKDKVYIIIKK